MLVLVKYCTAHSISALDTSGILSDAMFCEVAVISRCNPPKSCQWSITQTLFSDTMIDDQEDVRTQLKATFHEVQRSPIARVQAIMSLLRNISLGEAV